MEEHKKSIATEAEEPSSKSSTAGKSARSKEPAPKLDTPISALTHHSDSESDDDEDNGETKSKESDTESTRRGRRSTRGQKSIPKAIVTRGKKGSTLPAVPEGEALEDDDDEETSKPAAASTRNTTRASNSVSSSRRSAPSSRSTSARAATESVASRVSRRSTKGKINRYDE